jgi:hypothetical protein
MTNVLITTYKKDEEPEIVCLEDTPEIDLTILIGDSGIVIQGEDGMTSDDFEKLGNPIYGAVSVVQWKDAITLYQEYD